MKINPRPALLLICLLSLIGAGTLSAQSTFGPYQYNVFEGREVTIVRFIFDANGPPVVANIPETIEGIPVVTIRGQAFYNFHLKARYGFNTDQEVGGMAFVVKIGYKEIRLLAEITGVEPNAHNKEVNQLVIKDFKSLETIELPAGLHTIELRAEGAPAQFKRPPGRENLIFCYSAFPMLEELRLEPVLIENIHPTRTHFGT